MNLVEQIYKEFPEFKRVNNPIFDKYDFTVFGNFAAYLEDVVQIYLFKKIVCQEYFCSKDLCVDLVDADLESLITRSFTFIDNLYLNNDKHCQEVIVTSFFRILATSKYSKQFAFKYFSKLTFEELVEYGHGYWGLDRASFFSI